MRPFVIVGRLVAPVCAWSVARDVRRHRAIQRPHDALVAAYASRVDAYGTLYRQAGTEETANFTGKVILFDVRDDAPPSVSLVSLNLPPGALAESPEQAGAIGFVRSDLVRDAAPFPYYVDALTVVDARSGALVMRATIKPASLLPKRGNHHREFAEPTAQQIIEQVLALRR